MTQPLLAAVIVLLLGCRAEAPPDQSSPRPSRASSATEPKPVRKSPRPTAFRCQELRPPPKTERELVAETIELYPPTAGKKIVMSKTGVIVTFNRKQFLKAAHCLKLKQAIHYVEKVMEDAPEAPLMDAFQLSYVAAALLDAGRASVRLREESESRQSIVRDGWAADGCAGQCRSFGRLYRLSENDSSFFFRITDKTQNK